MIGAHCARGPGLQAALSIISKPTNPLTLTKSVSKAFRVMEKPLCSPWLTNPASLLVSSVRPERAAPKFCVVVSGEQVENIASTAEYHWMAGNFLKYAGPLTPNDLPVDANELIALCAPRPVFISSGSQQVEGGWVDAKGMFLAAVGAGPVYQLLGKQDLGATQFPPMETALMNGDIAFRQHAGGHTTGPNWPFFLTFAGRYIKGPSPAPSK